MKTISQYTKFAKELAKIGGKLSIQRLKENEFTSSSKKDNSFQTTIDVEVEKLLRKKIINKFPEHSIHGEEIKKRKKKSPYTWYLDPIDGTTNYFLNLPMFSTMIALVKKGQVISSAIYNSNNNKLYWAEKNKGSYINSKPVKIKKFKSINKMVLLSDRVRGKENQTILNKFISLHSDKFKSYKNLGCVSISSMLMLDRKTGVYIGIGDSLHDFIPPSLIISEAGGIILNRKMKAWSVNDSDWFIALAPEIKDQIISLLKPFS